MASIEQVVSEIAHSLKQADSVPVRRAIRLAIIHNRNKFGGLFVLYLSRLI